MDRLPKASSRFRYKSHVASAHRAHLQQEIHTVHPRFFLCSTGTGMPRPFLFGEVFRHKCLAFVFLRGQSNFTCESLRRRPLTIKSKVPFTQEARYHAMVTIPLQIHRGRHYGPSTAPSRHQYTRLWRGRIVRKKEYVHLTKAHVPAACNKIETSDVCPPGIGSGLASISPANQITMRQTPTHLERGGNVCTTLHHIPLMHPSPKLDPQYSQS